MTMSAVLLALELLGVFAFAVSGALLAVRKNFDIIASLLLASLAGLGGGVIRDLIVGDSVPTAFAQPMYLIPVVVAVFAVFLRAVKDDRLRRTLLVFDAVGLAMFCVMGAYIAHTAGMNAIAAILLGVTTAVGGGTLRDVVANEIPQIFLPTGVYAAPAFLGASVAVLALHTGWFNGYTAVAISATVFSIRLAALKWGWKVPLAALAGLRRSR